MIFSLIGSLQNRNIKTYVIQRFDLNDLQIPAKA